MPTGAMNGYILTSDADGVASCYLGIADVARQMGAKYIQAYVTEIQTAVPLDPDVQPDDLVIIASYAQYDDAEAHLHQPRRAASSMHGGAPSQARAGRSVIRRGIESVVAGSD